MGRGRVRESAPALREARHYRLHHHRVFRRAAPDSWRWHVRFPPPPSALASADEMNLPRLTSLVMTPSPPSAHTVSRRRFLQAAALLGGAVSLDLRAADAKRRDLA